MKKHIFLIILALALLALAGCSPATLSPAPTATTAAATPEPTVLAPATEEAVAVTPDTRPTVPAPAADGSRPLAALAAAERNERFSGPAATYVKPNTIYVATIVTAKGNIVAELYQDTPKSVNNFVTLALTGFYDGLTFHRVEPGFVIQGGDPLANSQGSPGYAISDGTNHFHNPGALAMANSGDPAFSSGSQFYITLDQTSFLDGGYIVFGNVIEGMDIAQKIEAGDTIQRIDITEATISNMPTVMPSPTPEPTATPTITPTPYAPTAQDGRPLATVSVAEREGIYNTAPAMTLDTTKTYQATIETDKGEIVIDLDAKLAPISVNSFVLLANLGYYDGIPIAYAEPNYLVTGSPASQPSSDVGYTVELEPAANASPVITGTVSLYPAYDLSGQIVANSGSEFLISLIAMEGNTAPLNVFGQVSSGLDVAQQLVTGDIIKTITITVK